MSSQITSLELRKCIREKYAWPGGYEMYGVCLDGGTLCCDCLRSEYRSIASAIRTKDIQSGWHVFGVDCLANTDELVQCYHCNKILQEGTQE